jgi:hypothetical protein
MRTLSTVMVQVLAPFAPLFSKRVWQHALVLLVGGSSSRQRTVMAALHVMGLSQSTSSFIVVRVLLGLLVGALAPVLVVGVDETLERRWGKKIAAKGIYRDPVHSSHEHFVKASALRWCVWSSSCRSLGSEA